MSDRDTESSDLPLVHVAMATYNGMRWIESQVQTILEQTGVRVHLVVSDDHSRDNTAAYLQKLADTDSRVTFLPLRQGSPKVAANFFYALTNTNVGEGEFFAFSDQDDLWNLDKLSQQTQLLRSARVDAVSSNVMVLQLDGSQKLLRKDQPQKRWDYIFETPGPSSTFVLNYRSFQLVKDYLLNHDVGDVEFHDWLVYALVRASNLQWMIDSRGHVFYRQHSDNVLGARTSLQVNLQRVQSMKSGFYRRQFQVIAGHALKIGQQTGRSSSWQMELAEIKRLLADNNYRSRQSLAKRCGQFRRKSADALSLSSLILAGWW